MVLVGLDGL